MSIIKLKIHVDDLASVLALFDRIEVYRSPTQLGTFLPITSETATPAKIEGTIAGPFIIDGQTLNVSLNGAAPIAINFAGTDPIGLPDVIDQVNAVIPGLAAESGPATNKIALTSAVLGTASSLLLTGTAVATLGLSLVKTNGLGAKLQLVFPTTEYEFSDFDGDTTFWYKTRYFSTATQNFSSFSDPRQGSLQIVLPIGSLLTGKIALADGVGRPIACRRVIFVAEQPITGLPGGYSVLPGFDRIEVVTDDFGKAQADLLRGQTFKVLIEGIPFQREFVVPTDLMLTEFDVLTLAATQPDPFNIVKTLPMPIRSS